MKKLSVWLRKYSVQYGLFALGLWLIVFSGLPNKPLIMYVATVIFGMYAEWKCAKYFAKKHPQYYNKNGWTQKTKDFCRHYYKNGQIKQEGKIKNGKNNGLWKGYYEDGRLMEEGNFKIGEKVGLWKYYNQDGQLKSN